MDNLNDEFIGQLKALFKAELEEVKGTVKSLREELVTLRQEREPEN